MKTILIIEDNNEIRENTAEMLELEGFSVVIAEDGHKGVLKAKDQKPDLILCDIMMPGLNGYEVCKELKSDPGTADIPVIFLTARSESTDVRAGLQIGARAYLSKPFMFEELMATIRSCVKVQ